MYLDQFIQKTNKQTSLPYIYSLKSLILFNAMHEVRIKLPMKMLNICSKIAPSCMDVRTMLSYITYRVMHLTSFLWSFVGWYVPYFPLSSSKYLHRAFHSFAVDISSVWTFSIYESMIVCLFVWMNHTCIQNIRSHFQKVVFIILFDTKILVVDDFLRSQKRRMGQPYHIGSVSFYYIITFRSGLYQKRWTSKYLFNWDELKSNTLSVWLKLFRFE